MESAKPQPPKLTVAAARDLGPQFVQNEHRMIGQDGAFSIPLDETCDEGRRTLWFFGDTLIGRRPPAGQSLWYPDGKPAGHRDLSGRGTIDRMINNTGLLLPRQSGGEGLKDLQYITDARSNQLKCLIPLEQREDEHPDWHRIWCQHGVCLAGKVYLSFIKVKMLEATEPLPVMFEILGSGLAVGSTKNWMFERIRHGGSSLLWTADQPHFATAFVVHRSDGYVYAYGTVKRKQVQQAYLARVRPAEIDLIDHYEYLASRADAAEPKWSDRTDDAAPLFSGMPSELSVSYNPHLGAYLAVHSLDLSGQIVGRTAAHPWGPWSEPAVLWTVKVDSARAAKQPYPVLIYAGKEHPELAGDNGRVIYLTYVEFEEYFPHLVEVTLA